MEQERKKVAMLAERQKKKRKFVLDIGTVN